MSHKPVFSVVMPSYNHEKFIDDAINSVVSQTVKDLELIIVDDFSTDNSRNIIRSWAKKDSRIKTILHRKNEGIAKTCNDGIRNARGKYIAMMASDDMFRENAFEKILALLESSEDCGVAILEAECIDSRNRRIGLFSEMRGKPSVHKGDLFMDLISLGKFLCTGVIRRAVLENYQIYYNENLKYFNDWLFWLDLSNVCKFVYIDEPLYYFRIHKASSKKYRIHGPFDEVEVYDIVLNKYGDNLDYSSKSELLKRKGISYARARKYDFKKCKEALYRSLFLTSSSIDRIKTILLILLSRPTLFRFYLNIEKYGNYKKTKILACARK